MSKRGLALFMWRSPSIATSQRSSAACCDDETDSPGDDSAPGRALLRQLSFRLRAVDSVEMCSWECFREGTKSRPVVVRLMPQPIHNCLLLVTN